MNDAVLHALPDSRYYRVTYEVPDNLDHVVVVYFRQGGPHAEPERAVHYGVGVSEVAHHAVFDVAVSRLPQQVAGEKQAGANLVGFEVLNEVGAAQGRVVAQGEQEAKPARLAAGGRLGQDEVLLKLLHLA